MKRWQIILLCIIWVVIFAGFLPISLGSLTRRVEKEAVKLMQGDTLRLEGLSIQLWRGVSIKNAYYATARGKEPTIRLKVPEIRLSYHLIPLFWGKVRFYKILLKQPWVEMVSKPAPEAAATRQPLPMLPLPLGKIPMELPVDLEINTLLIEGASCRILNLPATEIMASGISADFSASLDKALEAGGEIRVDTIRVPGPFVATGFKTHVFLEPGKLEVSDCALEFYEGVCRAEMTVDTAADTLVRAEVTMKGLDLASLLNATGFDKGKVSGNADLKMRVSGKNLNLFQWQGRGKLELEKLDLSGLPFQKTLAALLFLPKLNHLKFDQVSTSLVMARGKVSTPDLKGTGNLMDFTGAGWVGLDMTANEKVHIILSNELCAHLPPLVSRDILLPEGNGRCGAGTELHGPLSNLKIELDQKTKARATNAIIKEAGSLLQNLFRKR